MQTSMTSARTSTNAFVQRHLGWFLGGAAFLVAAALSKPVFDTVDANVMFQVANGILHHGTPLVKIVGTLDGKPLVAPIEGTYPDYGLGMSVLWLPFMAIGQALGLAPLQLMRFVSPIILA